MRDLAPPALAGVTLVLVAGCLGGAPAAPPDDGPVLPGLAAFGGCDWRYPDGSDGPCQDLAVRLEPEPEPPQGWTCVHNQEPIEGPHWRLWWHPQGGHHGLEVMPQPGTGAHEATLRLRAQGGTPQLFAWSGDDGRAFVAFPEPLADPGLPPDHGITIRLFLHRVDASLDHDGAGEVGISSHWSLYEDQFWLTYEVMVGGDRHTFRGTNTTIWAERTAEGMVYRPWHAPESMRIAGADFDFVVDYDLRGHTRSPYALDGATPDRFCLERPVL